MPSPKTQIVEALFNERWDEQAGSLRQPVIMLQEVTTAIQRWNQEHPDDQLSARNPANFFKDLTRRRATANASWPTSVFERGYTARQVTGASRCFEFVPVRENQTEPFPLSVPAPTDDTPRHEITSAVLPIASRAFGRSDEPWLLQVAVRLRVIETHLSLFSSRKDRIRQVDHLQNSVKLRESEIDAIFLGIEEITPGEFQQFIITCEAKREHEDLNLEQLVRQPQAAFKTEAVTQDVIVPMALKVVGHSKIHVIEFAEVRREDAEALETLTIESDAVYSLLPPVEGIGPQTRRNRNRRASGGDATTGGQ